MAGTVLFYRVFVLSPVMLVADSYHQVERDSSLCKPNERTSNSDWKNLCSSNFVKKATQLLLNNDEINVVQIGAHTGFEINDPVAKGLSILLDEVAGHTTKNEMRKHFHWTFVEPSPPNFKRLEENLIMNSNICDMKSINAAVVSDHAGNTSEMVFYSIRDTIDPETGHDFLNGKKLPYWITQVSSFDKAPILFNKNIFRRNGLNVSDYIVETNVITKSYSNLMKEALVYTVKNQKQAPLLVLIDTEGFDCEIIKGISPSSQFLPEYLLFEHKQCKDAANEHLRSMGYSFLVNSENTLAFKEIVE